jgi:hypothetical protein
VTRDEVVDLARVVFRPETMTLSLLGDFDAGAKIEFPDFGS